MTLGELKEEIDDALKTRPHLDLARVTVNGYPVLDVTIETREVKLTTPQGEPGSW